MDKVEDGELIESSLSQDYINLPTPEFHSAAFADDEMGKSVAIDLIRMSPSNGREGEPSLVFKADFILTILLLQPPSPLGANGKPTVRQALLELLVPRASTEVKLLKVQMGDDKESYKSWRSSRINLTSTSFSTSLLICVRSFIAALVMWSRLRRFVLPFYSVDIASLRFVRTA